VAELVYPPVLVVARTGFVGLGMDFTITGTEHVPRSGGAVLAVNHISYLDFAVAGLAARPSRRLVRFMAKQAIFDHPVSGPLMRGMHHISVDRAAGGPSYAAAVTALGAGEVVGLFPEATTSPSLELLPFKNGAARLAQDAGVPLIPVVIWGSQRVLTKGHRRGLRPLRIPISVDVGAPEDDIAALRTGQLTHRLRTRMEGMLHAAQERYPDHPRPGEDPWWVPARLGGTAPTAEEGWRIVAHRRDGRTAADHTPDPAS